MKSVAKTLTLAVAIILVACSKDEGNSKADANSVIGAWRVTDFYQTGKTTVAGQTASTSTATGSMFGGMIIFAGNDTFVNSIEFEATIITDYAGQFTDTTTVDFTGLPSWGTWKVDGNGDLLLTTFNDETYNFNVLQANDEAMEMEMTIAESDTFQGVVTTVESTASFRMEKEAQ